MRIKIVYENSGIHWFTSESLKKWDIPKKLLEVIASYIFNRCIMKWNATIIVTFFRSTQTDQNSSWKFYQILVVSNWNIWLRELNQKGFSFFPRNMQYGARPKVPPSGFFGIARLFFRKKIAKWSPLQFFWFCDKWKIANGPPFSAPIRSSFWVFRVL